MNFSEAAARLLLITPHFPYRKYLARLIKNTRGSVQAAGGYTGSSLDYFSSSALLALNGIWYSDGGADATLTYVCKICKVRWISLRQCQRGREFNLQQAICGPWEHLPFGPPEPHTLTFNITQSIFVRTFDIHVCPSVQRPINHRQ